MSETPSAEKDAGPNRRPCPDCGGYTFKSTGGIWRHWADWPETATPVECPIPPANGGTDE